MELLLPRHHAGKGRAQSNERASGKITGRWGVGGGVLTGGGGEALGWSGLRPSTGSV